MHKKIVWSSLEAALNHKYKSIRTGERMGFNLMVMNRDTDGSDNYVISNIDKMLATEGKFSLSTILVTVDQELTIGRRLYPAYSGIHLRIPVGLVSFLSCEELQILLNFNVMTWKNIGDPFSQICKKFGSPKALGVLLKSAAVEQLWLRYIQSIEFDHLINSNPSSILFEFHILLRSKAFLDSVNEAITGNLPLRLKMKQLSDEDLSDAFDHAAKEIYLSRIFDINAPDFVQHATYLFIPLTDDNVR